MSKVKNDDEEEEEDFDTFLIHHNDKHRRALASKIASSDRQNGWTDEDIELLLNKLEIEVGEGTNRFVYEDERPLYCLYLSQNIEFEQPKSPEQIFDKILWLWSAWESISRATGKSWWNTTEQEKYEQSLLSENKDQQLKLKFKYFDKCDRIFAYIREEDDYYLKLEKSNSNYY